MRNISKIILAALLAMLVIVSMSAPSFAEDTGTITITNSNEAVSMNGHTYKAYKIFDVTYNNEKTDYDYTVAEPFDTYFESLNLPASLGEDLDARAYAYVAAISGDEDLQAFARDIYESAGEAAGSVTSTSATSAVIEGLAPGYYLVYDEGNPTATDNAEKAIANVALTTADPDAEIVLKASVPTIEKKITGVSDDASNDSAAQGEDRVSAQLGQHVGFQIDSIVPDLTGYTNYIYKVTDTMTEGLTPDQNVKVTIGSDDVTSDCNITYNGQVTTVAVPFDTLKEYDADTPIAITYSAKVNADAEVYPSATANSNEAELEYSTNITDETIKETTPPSNVNVYVFTLDITKVNADNEVLPGAKFVLKDSADNFIPVALDGGRYVVSDTLEANEENATVISDSNGKIYIDGVSEGTYTLTEIEAPENYNLLKEPVELTVTATYNEDGECTGVSGNSATVVNKAGGILPSTGGIGTLIFTASGAAVMLMAAVILVSKKRKSEAK